MEMVNDNIVFGLDIGTRSVVGIVGYRQADAFHILAAQTKMHDTRSMIDGQIHDIEQVAKTIHFVKSALEAKIGKTLKKTCIAAAGRVLKTMQTHVDLEIEDHLEISKELILSLELQGMEKAMHQINYNGNNEDQSFYCVGYSVMNYYLNDFVMKNLEGHKGNKISADILSTFLPSEVVNSLYKVIEKAGLEVYSLTLEPIAAIEVAIPKSYRLLNIALIDIGAGTSDIAITKDGSIVAYGMIPYAGDEITESIVHEYLVDFKTAEKIKIKASGRAKTTSFKDAIGLKQTIELEHVRQTMAAAKQSLAQNIAQKVKELNGGHPTNAVFIVGGGGQISGFENLLASILELPEQRVAIRGKDVLQSFQSDDKDFKKRPEYVTPIGICLTGLNNNQHDFVEIFLNDESIRVFNTNRLTVMDVVALKGIDPKSFIGRRGKNISYRLNQEERILRGGLGEAAKIYINQKEANLSSPIKMHDYITIIPAVDGQEARVSVRDVLGENNVFINGEKKLVEIKLRINGLEKSPLTTIHDQDDIQCIYPTIDEVLKSFYIDYTHVFVDEIEVKPTEFININSHITTFFYKTDTDTGTQSKDKEEITITVYINDEAITLKGKKDYLFVDIFDFYPFDRTIARGKLISKINGSNASFMDSIHHGDKISLYWEEKEK